MAPESKLPETVGRYRVVRELGKGAMGRVLLAHDPVLKRDVAVKHLRADLPLAPEQRSQLLDRMQQEARASARVSHPNLVALHDMGQDPGVGLYLVFEYVEGPTLKEALERGPLDAEVVATMAREVGSGLRLLHSAGVIHRDVKPENVILSKTGAKLTDFGIARVPDSTLTGAGNVLGTPAYSAPEAIRSSKFSPFSDQFSMAATLYEALSGRRAFPGDDAVFVAAQIANDEPPRIAAVCGVPTAVDTVLARGLAKHPSSRFEDCEVFGAALADALVPEARPSLSTLPDSYHTVAAAPSQRPRVVTIGVALVAGAAAMWAGNRMFEPEARESEVSIERVEPVAIAPAAVAEAEDSVPPVAWLSESPKHLPKRTPDDASDDEDDKDDAELADEPSEDDSTDRAVNAAGAADDTSPKPGR
jgi:serine/threonine-protein kinase